MLFENVTLDKNNFPIITNNKSLEELEIRVHMMFFATDGVKNLSGAIVVNVGDFLAQAKRGGIQVLKVVCD
jgi:hypothetical protein